MSRQRTAGEDDYLAFKARMVAIRRVAVVLLGLFGVVLLALGLLHVADVHLPGRGWLGVLSVVLAGVAFGSIVVTRHVLRSHALKRLPLRRARIVGLDFGESAVTLAVDTAGGCTCVTTSIGGLTDSDTVEFGQELAIRLPPHLEDPFIDWLETHRLFPRPLPLIATIESVQRQPENQAVLSLLVEGPDGLGLSLSGVCLQVGPVNQHWLRRWNELAVRVTSGGVIVDWTATSLHHRSGGLRPEPSPEERRAQAAARETQRCAYRVAALTHAIEQLDDKCGIYRTGKLSMTAVASMALLVGIIGTIFSTVLLRPWLFAQQGVWVFAGSSFVVCTAIGAPLAWTEQVFNKRARQAQVPALEQQLASLKKERDGLERHETHGGPFR